ncbi:MAG: hypothetical protein ACM3TT_05370 [Syntrophothermus sp.]
MGNVLGIENKAQGVSQSFQYDDLYQLVGAEGTAAIKKGKSQNHYAQTFEYGTIGNILRKTSANRLTPGNNTPKDLNYDFAYKYDGTRPHAPTQIGAWTYQYDDNGNVVRKDRITGPASSGNVNDGDSQGGTYRLYMWDIEHFRTFTDEALERWTTVDMAARELQAAGRPVTVETVLRYLDETPAWRGKLMREEFRPELVEGTLKGLRKFFGGSEE